MKQKNHHRNLYLLEAKAPRYPNAAGKNYYIRKAVDVAAAIISGLGLVSVMLFMVILS